MDRLFPTRWDRSLPTRMAIVDNGECPFDPQLAGKWLEHLCDLLQFLTGRQFDYAGIVAEDITERGTIYHKYVPTASNDFWAWANHRATGSNLTGGLIQYRADKMPLPEHFAGLCLHETLHCLGVRHFNTHPSIMNNNPYNGHPWQAGPMAADYFTLMMLFGGPMRPLWPSAYDYGDLSLEKCLIHIPSIMWQPGSYAALWLEGKQEDGKWILEAPSYAIRHHAGYVGRPVATIEDGVLHIPLRYDKATIEVVAPMIQFTNPSSKVRFEVSEIHPIHVHSAFDI